ncbi:MAG: hydrolase, alpha [Rhodospirillales bacterium]|nr:hydrolase, alpha [Rhodospirillales bacterium]
MPKPTLILLPGQLCDAALWESQRQALSDIADIRIGDLTLDDSVAAMAGRTLADAPARFALCGLSLGGYAAFEIIRRAPERVTHLGLMNTSARADAEEQSERRERSVRAARIGAFKGVTPRFLPTIIHPDHAADPAMAKIVLEMTERVGRVAFESQQHAAIGRPDSRALLPSIRCPVLVVGGREDRVAPPPLQQEIATGIAGARLEILETCGHLAPIEQADEVNRLMRAWLS